MTTVFLNRFEKTEQGTFGVWACPELSFICYALELPWKNNKNKVSCIPADTYIVEIMKSHHYGYIYHITSVQGRSWILTHWGNWAGNTKLGYKTNSQGCILLGAKRGILCRQRAILNSRITVKKFMRVMKGNKFTLIIK